VPLEREQLTPAASINRVLLADGASRRRPAYELLSARALNEVILEQRMPLGLSDKPFDAVLALDRLLGSSGTNGDLAESVAETFVRRMSLLIATLKTGPAASRVARAEWDASYWQAWSDIRIFALGGGLLSGNLSRIVRRRLPLLLARAGVEVEVRVPAQPRSLPLIGAARSLQGPASRAAVLDFGHSAIKRAIASYSGARLHGLRLLDPIPALVLEPGDSGEASALSPDEIGRRIAHQIAGTWQEVRFLTGDEALSPTIICSMACYLKNGQPYPGASGLYGALEVLSPNLAGWLSHEVSDLLNTPVEVRLIHDGTAAAMAYGEENLAVILFGTALGVGLSSSGARLMALSDEFRVSNPVLPAGSPWPTGD
jgi:hypothetical protein